MPKKGSFARDIAGKMRKESFAKSMFLYELAECEGDVHGAVRSAIRKMDAEWVAEKLSLSESEVVSFVDGDPRVSMPKDYLSCLNLMPIANKDIAGLKYVGNEDKVNIQRFIRNLDQKLILIDINSIENHNKNWSSKRQPTVGEAISYVLRGAEQEEDATTSNFMRG